MPIKGFKKALITLLLALFVIPQNILAYSDYIMAGGENIGIQLNSKGIMIVGLYKINDVYLGKEAGLKVGDSIISINNNSVNSISEMVTEINKSKNKNSITIGYTRSDKTYQTNLKLYQDTDNVYKTGLYVKDTINGIGTLTFIDPNTKLYGALGHEITEKATGQKIEIKDGKIFKSDVTSVEKSENGRPGEKNAKFYSNEIYGKVSTNTTSGIFGEYTDTLPDKKLYKVANPNEIKKGSAKILTVVNENKIEEYEINIIKINKNQNKNILFEITDSKLLEKTGGIVQGMSGSPIIQDDKIIGAVTHVVIDDTTRGYGIFITSMLEEAEKGE